MAQSLSNVLLHIVFSTKKRQLWIDNEIETDVHQYVAGICREMKCPSHKVGGTDDHLHIACTLSRTVTISKLVEEVKTGSSKWIKTRGDQYVDFTWQNGYGAFSIGQSQLNDLCTYIANQRAHHQRMTFQDEFRALLVKYDIDFNELFVWD
jgi:REP element-mobilizing transposase RayT